MDASNYAWTLEVWCVDMSRASVTKTRFPLGFNFSRQESYCWRDCYFKHSLNQMICAHLEAVEIETFVLLCFDLYVEENYSDLLQGSLSKVVSFNFTWDAFFPSVDTVLRIINFSRSQFKSYGDMEMSCSWPLWNGLKILKQRLVCWTQLPTRF